MEEINMDTRKRSILRGVVLVILFGTGITAMPLQLQMQEGRVSLQIQSASAVVTCVSSSSTYTAADKADKANWNTYLTRDTCPPFYTDVRTLPGVAATSVDEFENKKREASATNACGNLWDWIGFTCFFRLASVGIGTALITLTAWLLALAGYLFNFFVDHTIISFGKLFTPGVQQALAVGWSAMRDLANIVIISMFVFIAINMILGVKEFGEKKLVARVLIIAVLLNFSLLFSKGIIDAGNFIAFQFYKASNLGTDVRTTQGIGEDEFVKNGIAGQFVKFMGLPTAGKSLSALTSGAFGTEKNNYNGNAWLVLLYGLVVATLFLLAAAVLIYGCYLMLTRAVLLIFVMLVSAIKFFIPPATTPSYPRRRVSRVNIRTVDSRPR